MCIQLHRPLDVPALAQGRAHLADTGSVVSTQPRYSRPPADTRTARRVHSCHCSGPRSAHSPIPPGSEEAGSGTRTRSAAALRLHFRVRSRKRVGRAGAGVTSHPVPSGPRSGVLPSNLQPRPSGFRSRPAWRRVPLLPVSRGLFLSYVTSCTTGPRPPAPPFCLATSSLWSWPAWRRVALLPDSRGLFRSQRALRPPSLPVHFRHFSRLRSSVGSWPLMVVCARSCVSVASFLRLLRAAGAAGPCPGLRGINQALPRTLAVLSPSTPR